MSGDTLQEQQSFRQNLVDEASKFLTNPNVVKHGLEQKSAFLRKKGLNEAEITAAYEKAKAFVSPIQSGASSVVAVYPPGPSSSPPVPLYTLPLPPSGWVRVRDACNLVLLLSGASYGLYLLYKKFVVPWLTGRREKTVEESMVELQQSVVTVLREVQTTLQSLQLTLTAQSAHIQPQGPFYGNPVASRKPATATGRTHREALSSKEESQAAVTPRQLDQLRTEISSLKGLMIGKRTFPSTPNPAPSIPSWQLSKTTGKPMDTALEGDLPLPSQTEVMEGVESVASGVKLKETHFNHHPPAVETLTLHPSTMENGEVRGKNEEVAGGGMEDVYSNVDSDSEDEPF